MTASDPSIVVYSTNWCPHCHRLKAVLNKSNIAYQEINIEQDPTAAEFVASVNGGNRTVPTVRFPDGSTLTNPSGRDVQVKLAKLAR